MANIYGTVSDTSISASVGAVIVSGGFAYDYISSSLTIPEHRQMLVIDGLTLEADLLLEGSLILEGGRI